MQYNAPNWVNNGSPAINAANLQAISDTLEQDGQEIQTLQTQLANPFNYKGVVAAVENLPSSGNTINDTYYVTAATCLYTWNGSAWSVSSLSESDYLDILQQVLNDIAETYNSSSTYAVGDYCIYNNSLYRCTTAITTAEAFTVGHWTAVNVTGEVSDLKNDIQDQSFLYRIINGENLNELHNGDDCDLIYKQGCYRKLAEVNVTHWPAELSSSISILLVFSFSAAGVGLQMCGDGSGNFFVRYNSATTHGIWYELGLSADIDNISNKAFMPRSNLTASDNIDNIVVQGCYKKEADVAVSGWPTKLASAVSFCLVFGSTSNGPGIQVCCGVDGVTFIRYNSTATHGTWYEVPSGNDFVFRKGVIPANTNMDKSLGAGVYQKGTASTDLVNWPSILTNAAYVVANFKSLSTAGFQLFCGAHDLYYRYVGSSVNTLHKVAIDESYVVDKNGGGDFTSFTECIYSLRDVTRPKTIYVMGGEYDIYQEYLDNNVPVPPTGESSSNYKNYNRYIPYNTKVVGLGNVVFKWEPADGVLTSAQLEIWSPLNVRGNVEIENITVKGKNCRYLIHDDTHNEYTKNYHIYKNLYLERTEKGDSDGNAFNSVYGSAWADKCEYVFENVMFVNKSIVGYCIWSHDAPQATGETRDTYSGASINFVNCSFTTVSNLNDIVLGGGVNNILQDITFTRCVNLAKIWLRKTQEASIQPYVLKVLGSGNPTITIDDANNQHIPVVIQ